MSTTIPEELKVIQPWLQRSQELLIKEPLISYFLKYYALQQAMPLAGPSSKPFLFTLMDELEQVSLTIKCIIILMKIKNQMDPELLKDEYAYPLIEDFALKIFIRSDNEDRSGKASKYIQSRILKFMYLGIQQKLSLLRHSS
jgi:vacuolar protein sorting-associated protein VTA1